MIARSHPETSWSALLTGPDSDLTTPVSGLPLEGLRIAVTSDRRSADLIEAFERRGAEVLHAPAVRIAPVQSDDLLIADTRAVIAVRPAIVLVTTAYGFRRWIECADAAGLGEQLRDVLGAASILVRGPKARGAVRAAGFEDVGIASDERTATAVDLALERGVTNRWVLVQLHGLADVEQLGRLEAARAKVLTVAPYRWVRPTDGSRLERLISAIVARDVDVVTFTAAPAVDALFSAAQALGREEALAQAMVTDVKAAAVGPVTAAPLQERGIDPIVPQRFRMGALIRAVVEHVESTGVREVSTDRGVIRLQGRMVIFGAERVALARGQRLLLAMLMDHAGTVVSRDRLMDAVPEIDNEHALEMAVSRLRVALPDRDLIQTVLRRGYRLAP